MIKAVIFDLDGVLVTTDELHFKAWSSLAEELGIKGFTKSDNARQRGVSRMASLEILLEKTDRQFTDEEKEELAERKNEMYIRWQDKILSQRQSCLLSCIEEKVIFHLIYIPIIEGMKCK